MLCARKERGGEREMYSYKFRAIHIYLYIIYIYFVLYVYLESHTHTHIFTEEEGEEGNQPANKHNPYIVVLSLKNVFLQLVKTHFVQYKGKKKKSQTTKIQ